MKSPYRPNAHIWNRGGARAALVLSLGLVMLFLGCRVTRTPLQPDDPRSLAKRVDVLEKALETLALRTDSVTIGLERLSARLDSIRAPSAQWLALETSGVLRWYLDEDLQNVYARFAAWDGEKRALALSMTSRLGTSAVSLRVGESREIRLQGAGAPHVFLLSLLHVATLEDGRIFALLSFSEGGSPGS